MRHGNKRFLQILNFYELNLYAMLLNLRKLYVHFNPITCRSYMVTKAEMVNITRAQATAIHLSRTILKGIKETCCILTN